MHHYNNGKNAYVCEVRDRAWVAEITFW